MMLAILLSFILFLILLHCFIRYGRVGRLISLIPGPKEYPIIGNMHHYQVDNDHLMETGCKLNNKYYPIYKIWSFFIYMVFLLDPNDIEGLLGNNEHIEKGYPYNLIQSWLSTGLLTSGGKKWKLRRKMLKPAFYLDILPHYFTNIIEISQNMVECLKKEADGNPIVKDLKSFIGQHTLNIICKSAFGVELTGKNELEIKYPHAIHEFVRISSIRLSRPWYYFDSIFAFSPLSRVQKENLKTLHSFSRNIIAERKRFHKQTNGKYLQINKNNEEDNNLYSKKRLSLLDLLIAASWEDNQIDEEGIREEVDTFMFGGFDTTASALTFALSLFAKHKSVQKNIRDEVRSIMQDDNFTMSSLSNLSYLNRCLKESMRLYPSVHVIFRKIFRDLQLKHYLIPSGTIVGVNIYSVHRNPKYWPNPNVFDPDRFLPENIKGRHPYSFIPFSAGRRICIGQNFAMHELRLIVAFILYHFELEPVDELDDVTFAANITLTPIKPLRIKFIPIS